MKTDHMRLRDVGREVDLDLAVRCVELSRMAYRHPADAAVHAQANGYSTYNWLAQRNDRDFLFVTNDDRLRYVVFRGTDERADWRTNLSFLQMNTPYGAVHRGFYSVCETFFPQLQELLESLPDYPIVFTGHSMGGALALIAAVKFSERRAPVHSIYTFGQPKTGGRSFSNYVLAHLNVPYLRFVNGADAIAAWGLGQRTLLGNACYFDMKGRLQFGRHLKGMPRLSWRLHGLQHYRFYLRLNRMKLQALEESEDVTVMLP